MRARVVVAAMVVLGGCASGDGGPFPPASTTSSTVTTVAPAPSTTASGASSTTVPAGVVTLRVSGFTLPEASAGATGLRLTVRAASDRLTLRRRGGGGAVSVCPAAGAVIGGCADLGAGTGIEVPAAGGVELRAAGARATVEEVAVTYVPAARTTTIVTPSRPAGACAAVACEATFSLTPGGAGAFVLDGRAAGGRPRLVLTALSPNSNRTLATVEGGAALSIRATLEAGSEARLLHHELTEGPVAPVTAEISWP